VTDGGSGDGLTRLPSGVLLPSRTIVVPADAGRGADAPARLSDDQLGTIAVRLALSFPQWIERRVEHVAFLDDTTVRQRESVTLRWPEPDFFPAGARPRPRQTIYVPLDVLRKRPLIEVDVARPDGSTFPILSTRRNGEMAESGMTTAIWQLSEDTRDGRGLEEDHSFKVIAAVVKSPRSHARTLLADLDAPDSELGAVLKDPDEIRGLLRELGSNFLLLAPAVYEPGVETVLKYSYSQPLPWKLSLRNLAATLGLADFRSDLSRLALGYAESYHIEIEAPEDVRLTRARLFGSYVDSSNTGRVTVAITEDGDNPVVDLHARRPTAATLKLAEDYKAKPAWKRVFTRKPGVAPLPPQPLAAADAAQPTPVARSDRGFAQVSFRPRVSGPFIAAVVVSALTSALLIGARTRLPELDGQVGSAVLLALPVLAAGYLTRPGEHAFATRLLGGVRGATLVVGICSLVVAAILGGGYIDKPQPSPAAMTCAPADGHHRLAGARDLRCLSARQTVPEAKVPNAVRNVVDLATIISVVLSGILVVGLLRTWTWPTVRLQKDVDDDDVI
jgi:hypothetical protein